MRFTSSREGSHDCSRGTTVAWVVGSRSSMNHSKIRSPRSRVQVLLLLGGVTACGGIAEVRSPAPQDAGPTVGQADGRAPVGSDSGAADAADEAPVGIGTLTIGAPPDTPGGPDIYGNCMPVVMPDPVIAFWTQRPIVGGRGTIATLAEATLTITGSWTVTQHLTLDHPNILLTGGAGSQAQRKTGADMNPRTVLRP